VELHRVCVMLWSIWSCMRNVMWCRSESAYWIGLFKNDTEWVDGNPSSYRTWHPDEPDSTDQCISYTTDGLRDSRCSNDEYFICEKGAGNLFSLTIVCKFEDAQNSESKAWKIHSCRVGLTIKHGTHVRRAPGWNRAPERHAVLSIGPLLCNGVREG